MSGNADVEAKIIDAIYRGACDAAELVRAIELIAAYFASPAAILAEIDQLQPECRLGIGVGVVDAQEFVRYGQYAHLDPMPRALAALPAGTVTSSNHIIPYDERRSVFVNEYLLSLGASETLGCPLLSYNGRFALISVLQGINRESYDAGDVARLERLTPHLTRALQIRRLFLQSEARGKTLEFDRRPQRDRHDRLAPRRPGVVRERRRPRGGGGPGRPRPRPQRAAGSGRS